MIIYSDGAAAKVRRGYPNHAQGQAGDGASVSTRTIVDRDGREEILERGWTPDRAALHELLEALRQERTKPIH